MTTPSMAIRVAMLHMAAFFTMSPTLLFAVQLPENPLPGTEGPRLLRRDLPPKNQAGASSGGNLLTKSMTEEDDDVAKGMMTGDAEGNGQFDAADVGEEDQADIEAQRQHREEVMREEQRAKEAWEAMATKASVAMKDHRSTESRENNEAQREYQEQLRQGGCEKKYEAEDALKGGIVATALGEGSHSGSGWVSFGDSATALKRTDYVQFVVTCLEGGKYEAHFQYARASGSGSMFLAVNGQGTSLSMSATGSENTWQDATHDVTLAFGENTITLTGLGSGWGEGGVHLDALTLTRAAVQATPPVETVSANVEHNFDGHYNPVGHASGWHGSGQHVVGGPVWHQHWPYGWWPGVGFYGYNCLADYDQIEGWSAEKYSFCCGVKQVGCTTTTSTYLCNVECLDQTGMACDVDLSNWTYSHKAYCCEHTSNKIGCEHTTSNAPWQVSAEAVCEGKNWTYAACMHFGCCLWDDYTSQCHSAVASQPCRPELQHMKDWTGHTFGETERSERRKRADEEGLMEQAGLETFQDADPEPVFRNRREAEQADAASAQRSLKQQMEAMMQKGSSKEVFPKKQEKASVDDVPARPRAVETLQESPSAAIDAPIAYPQEMFSPDSNEILVTSDVGEARMMPPVATQLQSQVAAPRAEIPKATMQLLEKNSFHPEEQTLSAATDRQSAWDAEKEKLAEKAKRRSAIASHMASLSFLMVTCLIVGVALMLGFVKYFGNCGFCSTARFLPSDAAARKPKAPDVDSDAEDTTEDTDAS